MHWKVGMRVCLCVSDSECECVTVSVGLRVCGCECVTVNVRECGCFECVPVAKTLCVRQRLCHAVFVCMCVCVCVCVSSTVDFAVCMDVNVVAKVSTHCHPHTLSLWWLSCNKIFYLSLSATSPLSFSLSLWLCL